MVTSSEAEQTLKTIRGLMERATIYRAISAPVALLAGVLSSAYAAFLYFKSDTIQDTGIFVWSWFLLLGLVLGFNLFLLRKAALRRRDPFLSPGMKLAARGAFAPMLAAIVFSWAVARHDGYPMFIALFWILFYGLALLSTREFAPVSIVRLGYSFLVFGLVCFCLYPTHGDPVQTAALAMGLSFGLLHLVYALATWPRQTNELET